MKNRLITLLLASLVLLSSCGDRKPSREYDAASIPFETARGYFLRNDVKIAEVPQKITSKETLLRYFGMATVMGPEGKPSAIDFDRSFVIPILYPPTNRKTRIAVESFTCTTSDAMHLKVKSIRGKEALSYTSLPCQLLIVDASFRERTITIHQE